jgi:hypothetical protein
MAALDDGVGRRRRAPLFLEWLGRIWRGGRTCSSGGLLLLFL